MRELKYIIVYPSKVGLTYTTAILFNGTISHAEMVPKGYKALSGGFCSINGISKKKLLNIEIDVFTFKVYGKAESLKIESLPSDKTIIEDTINCTHLFM